VKDVENCFEPYVRIKG